MESLGRTTVVALVYETSLRSKKVPPHLGLPTLGVTAVGAPKVIETVLLCCEVVESTRQKHSEFLIEITHPRLEPFSLL